MNNRQHISHTKWECKNHVVWIPRYRKKKLFLGSVRDLQQEESGKALASMLAEMYAQGVSTRKVKATEELCGLEFSATAVSAIAKRLNGQLSQFASRVLQYTFSYLILGARYENVPEPVAATLPRTTIFNHTLCFL